MRTTTKAFDEALEALRLADYRARQEALEGLGERLSARAKAFADRQKTFFLFRESRPAHPRGPKADAGQAMAETLISISVPAWASADGARTRALTEQRQTVLALTFAAWKAERGAYPTKAIAGNLKLRPETLVDPFSGRPFVDRTLNGKRQFVSVGYDGLLGSKINPGDRGVTAADLAAAPPVDDIVLELP